MEATAGRLNREFPGQNVVSFPIHRVSANVSTSGYGTRVSQQQTSVLPWFLGFLMSLALHTAFLL
jgi:hypothetical protein